MDYGTINDGTCEWSFLSRCTKPATRRVMYGQFGGWVYSYCENHWKDAMNNFEDPIDLTDIM